MNGHIEERRKMISDAFHSLNQPLTGLHCGLEIALQKPRTDEEYRNRIGTGLENAGAILQLIRAVRLLVDAADPGERFGTVDLALVLGQLKGELEVVAEALQVEVTIHCEQHSNLMADPLKLMAALGTLADEQIRSAGSGAQVEIETIIAGRNIAVTMRSAAGNRPETSDGLDHKLAEIRCNAACCYLWSIGGEVEFTGRGLFISLPQATK